MRKAVQSTVLPVPEMLPVGNKGVNYGNAKGSGAATIYRTDCQRPLTYFFQEIQIARHATETFMERVRVVLKNPRILSHSKGLARALAFPSPIIPIPGFTS
jgi:hypothetical protein